MVQGTFRKEDLQTLHCRVQSDLIYRGVLTSSTSHINSIYNAKYLEVPCARRYLSQLKLQCISYLQSAYIKRSWPKSSMTNIDEQKNIRFCLSIDGLLLARFQAYELISPVFACLLATFWPELTVVYIGILFCKTTFLGKNRALNFF